MRHDAFACSCLCSSVSSFKLVAQYSAVPSQGSDAEYFNFSKIFQPDDGSVTARQSGLRNCLQFAATDSNFSIFSQAGQKMPAQRATQFQVFNRGIPTIETNKFRVETTRTGTEQHFSKMVILGFAVTVFIKDAIINRNATNPISPQQGNQVDAIDYCFLCARPMLINQSIKLGIWIPSCQKLITHSFYIFPVKLIVFN
jgi:hypothetical protein